MLFLCYNEILCHYISKTLITLPNFSLKYEYFLCHTVVQKLQLAARLIKRNNLLINSFLQIKQLHSLESTYFNVLN